MARDPGWPDEQMRQVRLKAGALPSPERADELKDQTDDERTPTAYGQVVRRERIQRTIIPTMATNADVRTHSLPSVR